MDTQILPPQVGEILEKGQQSAVNNAKTVVSDVSNTISDQVGLKNETNVSGQQTQSPNLQASEPTANVNPEDLDVTKEIVSDYYSPSQVQSNAQQAELEEQQRQVKLTQVRQQLAQELHNENYFNQIRGEQTYSSQILHAGESKGQAQAQQQQEEVEEQKKMEDLQIQQKKQQDLSTFNAQRAVEIKGGIVG